ncbi:hypothetical protein [Allorhizobium ampelinum]|uniref:hypothetical protein n=1 Tax=Allorhizobium ampelinum TaxID=3025782 RepID=UPI001F271D5B|nr:hypothetical protein [Allorhizobium ampelinum]
MQQVQHIGEFPLQSEPQNAPFLLSGIYTTKPHRTFAENALLQDRLHKPCGETMAFP